MSAATRPVMYMAQSAPARWLCVLAMAVPSWRSRSTLILITSFAAGTLAAAHYCSRLHNHCATSPNSGSEDRWGISVTQDSRDSDFYSGCHSNNKGGDKGRIIRDFRKMLHFGKIPKKFGQIWRKFSKILAKIAKFWKKNSKKFSNF